MSPSPAPTLEDKVSRVVIKLMKGVLYRSSNGVLWSDLRSERARVADYLAVIGLDVVVDDAEGYAYLRSLPAAVEDPEVPRLVQRRRLSFPVSLLLALLRKRLAELDAQAGDTRLVLSRDQIVELLRIYLPESANEARVITQIDTHINKVVDLGFLRRTGDGEFEVRRILKAFVDGQWLADFDSQLRRYLAELTGETGQTTVADEEEVAS